MTEQDLEKRTDAIRDSADRISAIARDLIKHGQRDLTDREYVWLSDRLFHGRDNLIPFLQPAEYDALIRVLLGDARRYIARSERLVKELSEAWELNAKLREYLEQEHFPCNRCQCRVCLVLGNDGRPDLQPGASDNG